MTDNISRMYELAKVEKLNKVSIHLNKAYNFEFHETDTKSDFYPPFTDTKQLKLIKLLQINKYKQYLHFVDVISSYFRGLKFETKEEKRIFIDSEYPQKLAKLVCELWEDFTDTQREEIRGILK